MTATITRAAVICRPDVDEPDRRRAGVILLLLATGLFLAHGLLMLGAPFGDSHDGRNAGVWVSGGRALREAGTVASRLGTHSPEQGTYANHPPLIAVEIEVAQAVGGESPVATRAPAWLGSLIALALIWRLLRDAGLRASAAGTAVVLVAVTPMFLIFGTMLDTPVTSLPFGVALLLAWERTRAGRPVAPLTAFGLAALAVLAGWQALLLSGLIGLWALFRLRRGHADVAVHASFAGGFLSGLAVLVGWLYWAYGSTLEPLLAQFQVRTGQTESVSLGALLAAVGDDVPAMFGALVLLVAAAGLVVTLARPRLRGLALTALAVTVPYPFVFRSGAVNHDYWTYWLLLPAAVGLAVGCDALLRAVSARPVHERALAGAATLVAVMTTLGALWQPPTAARTIREGAAAGSVVAHAHLVDDQETAWYAGGVGKPAAWLAMETRRPAIGVSNAGLAGLAADHPDDQVLVGRVVCEPDRARMVYAFERAVVVAARPPDIGPCQY